MRPFSIGEWFVFGVDLERPRSWRDDVANLPAFDRWDAAQRRKHGFFAGLRFFCRANEPLNWLVASRHWPHKLCWDWSITAGIRRPKYDGHPMRISFVLSRKYRSIDVALILFKFHAAWQNYGYMPNSGPDKQEAPRLIRGNHLEGVEPMGSA
jgi:hypothetical protein